MRLAPAVLLLASAPTWADTVDQPTHQRRLVRGSARVTGILTSELGFPSYTYRASTDGFARIQLVTSNLSARDNGGRTWRPFIRVIGEADEARRGEGWSTNGDPDTARASLVIRVHTGQVFTIVATLGENMRLGAPVASATYTLAVAELAR